MNSYKILFLFGMCLCKNEKKNALYQAMIKLSISWSIIYIN